VGWQCIGDQREHGFEASRVLTGLSSSARCRVAAVECQIPGNTP
jgi:hypothetical protein